MALKEMLHGRRLTGLAACALGTVTLAGCTGTAHGVAGMELVDCNNGPKTNELVLRNFSKGKSFELGKNIQILSDGDGNGDAISGPLHVLSLGNGEFSVNLGSLPENADVYDRSKASSLGDPESPVRVEANGQEYDFSSRIVESGLTQLTIDASCEVA